MSSRKENAEPPRQSKPQPAGPPPSPTIDIAALLMIGDERMHIDREDDDNVDFMADLIDPP